MQIDPATRRANFLLMTGLMLFAGALCATVMLWMHHRNAKREGTPTAYPATSYYEPGDVRQRISGHLNFNPTEVYL